MLVVGSSEEYGAVAPEDLPINEDCPLRPTTPYAVSKIAQDYLGLQYYLSQRVEAVRVRPFNHIGPRQRQGFVAAGLRLADWPRSRAGCAPPRMVVGSLEAERDFSDVRDIVRGYYLALTRGRAGRGLQPGLRPLLLGALAAGYPDSPLGRRRRGRAGLRTGRGATSASRVVADCTRIYQATGWRPRFPSSSSLQDVLDYWRVQVRTGAADPTPCASSAPADLPEG